MNLINRTLTRLRFKPITKSLPMKYVITTIFFSTILVFNSCSEKVMVNCSDNNYMSKKNISSENYYQNRRELKTTLSKSDFDLSYDKFGISCSELLGEYLYCNICFNSDENSLSSYDGRKFKFKKNISSIQITNECLSLISSMTMGSNEYSEFLKTQK